MPQGSFTLIANRDFPKSRDSIYQGHTFKTNGDICNSFSVFLIQITSFKHLILKELRPYILNA